MHSLDLQRCIDGSSRYQNPTTSLIQVHTLCRNRIHDDLHFQKNRLHRWDVRCHECQIDPWSRMPPCFLFETCSPWSGRLSVPPWCCEVLCAPGRVYLNGHSVPYWPHLNSLVKTVVTWRWAVSLNRPWSTCLSFLSRLACKTAESM